MCEKKRCEKEKEMRRSHRDKEETRNEQRGEKKGRRITRLRQKDGENGRTEAARPPSSSQTEMERTEETGFKAAAVAAAVKHATADPSDARRTKGQPHLFSAETRGSFM